MKKRTAFIGVILSLMPLGQSLLIKTGIALVTSKIIILNSDSAIAESAEFYNKRGNQKYDVEDYKIKKCIFTGEVIDDYIVDVIDD